MTILVLALTSSSVAASRTTTVTHTTTVTQTTTVTGRGTYVGQQGPNLLLDSDPEGAVLVNGVDILGPSGAGLTDGTFSAVMVSCADASSVFCEHDYSDRANASVRAARPEMG